MGHELLRVLCRGTPLPPPSSPPDIPGRELLIEHERTLGTKSFCGFLVCCFRSLGAGGGWFCGVFLLVLVVWFVGGFLTKIRKAKNFYRYRRQSQEKGQIVLPSPSPPLLLMHS